MKATIQHILTQGDFRRTDYFLRLANGKMSKEEFIRSQYQFYYAVVHFIVPLNLVFAVIPESEGKMKVQRNIREENGEGDPSKTHGATFQEFLKRLTGEKSILIPEAGMAVSRFNQKLDETCGHPPYLTGVAMLGMIERMFAEISCTIGQEAIKCGWLKREDMIHYSTHEELDVIHAEDFFSILAPHFNSERTSIETGLKEGNRIFLELYQGLQSP